MRVLKDRCTASRTLLFRRKIVSRRLSIRIADTLLDGNDTEDEGYPVLLLNSLIGAPTHWSATKALLAGRCRIVTYDQRGCGGLAGSKDIQATGKGVLVCASRRSSGGRLRRHWLCVGTSSGPVISSDGFRHDPDGRLLNPG